MENYNELIGEDKDIERLTIRKGFLGYGFHILDRKVKENIFFSYYKEKVEDALKHLRENSSLATLPYTDNEVPPSKVIVFYEKHGDQIYEANTTEELFKVSLAVVKQRMDGQYPWYIEPSIQPLGFTEEEINAFPEGRVKDSALRDLKQYMKEAKWNEREVSLWDTLQKALKEDDGKLAHDFLINRVDHQYERFEIREPSKILV